MAYDTIIAIIARKPSKATYSLLSLLLEQYQRQTQMILRNPP